MKLSDPSKKKKARLEIIPLIDIMFFLVATFMMVSLSMIKNEGIEVNLPISSTSHPIERSQSITISINQENEIYLDKALVTLDELRSGVIDFRNVNPDGPILMNCDADSKMGKYLEVLDSLRLMGISNVSLQTKTQ